MSDTTEKEKPIVVETHDDGTASFKMPTDIKEKVGDKPLGRQEDDDDHPDTSGGGSGDQLSKSARRRQRAKVGKERTQQDLEALATVVHGQNRLIQALTRGQQANAIRTLEKEAQDCRSAYAEAEAVHAKAVTDGDGVKASEAQRVMHNSTAYYNQIRGQHAELIKQYNTPSDRNDDDQSDDRRQPQDRTQPPRLTQRQISQLTKLKDDFLDKYPEINPDGEDPRSRAIKAIDADVARDGFDPTTQDYWDEVSERLEEAGLVKVSKMRNDGDDRNGRGNNDAGDRNGRGNNDDRRPRRRQTDDDDNYRPTGGSGRDGGRGGGNNAGTRLSADMVKALEEAHIPLHGGDDSMIKRRNRILAAWSTPPQSR